MTVPTRVEGTARASSHAASSHAASSHAASSPPHAAPLRAGRVLGSWRLVTELGRGGMGTVYYAEHVTLQRRAAVKVLDGDIARDPELVARFFDEARAANRIGHPSIVDVADVGSADGLHYLVMELLVGETLGARLERVRRLEPAACVRVLAEAADALAAAHERGIVHRDLKPENLFLASVDGGERVKLLDFGVAKLRGQDDVRRTRTGLVLGTPTYMSPEQCLGERDLDARSDVYSLGVVAFEALTGRVPFVAESVGKLIVAHTHELPPRPTSLLPSIPPGLEEVVLRMLAKKREERFATMREVRHALDVALAPRLPGHLAHAFARSPAQGSPAAPSAEEIERIEAAQTREVGGRLREILETRLEQDRLPLPSMPTIVTRALDMLRDEHVALVRVARVLETDPLVATRLLRLANSAAYGATMTITSLDHAVARLGARNVRTMLTESVAREIFASRDPAVARAFRGIWEHSVAVGTLARELARGAVESVDELYVTGLLHDVGKPVVGALLLETERSLWDRLGAPWMGGSLWLKIVESSHAAVGAAVARKWALPERVVRVVASELGPDGGPEAAWLAYAHALAVASGHGGSATTPDDAADVLERARLAVGGSVELEQAALARVGAVLAPPVRDTKATLARRR